MVWLLTLYQCVTSEWKHGSQVKQYNINITYFLELKMSVELIGCFVVQTAMFNSHKIREKQQVASDNLHGW